MSNQHDFTAAAAKEVGSVAPATMARVGQGSVF